jgi:hypothetical protein
VPAALAPIAVAVLRNTRDESVGAVFVPGHELVLEA